MLLPMARPVDPQWKCQKSGECCTQPDEVVMTIAEKLAILRADKYGVPTKWRDLEGGMVALEAHPCPFYLFKECTVYDARPFNCRRFACLRSDVKTEPFEMDAEGQCVNWLSRIAHSRVARRIVAAIERKAQRWARKHGWSEN